MRSARKQDREPQGIREPLQQLGTPHAMAWHTLLVAAVAAFVATAAAARAPQGKHRLLTPQSVGEGFTGFYLPSNQKIKLQLPRSLTPSNTAPS